ncbi:hypothetical protein [Bacillus sp. FJAT-45037]|uniref:hypothetical protein n=1 Tax=Bacillus sp. FJAT-45037 TaxID=2011007 RepID=UPI000C23C500|nr:hypothetical protein [Bacillus sp. FJAT-45037]
MKWYISLLVGLFIISLVACSQPTKSSTNQMNSFPIEAVASIQMAEKMTVYLWEDENDLMPLISHDETPELTKAHKELLHLLIQDDDQTHLYEEFEVNHQDLQEVELIVMGERSFDDSPIFKLDDGLFKRTLAVHSLRSQTDYFKRYIQPENLSNNSGGRAIDL